MMEADKKEDVARALQEEQEEADQEVIEAKATETFVTTKLEEAKLIETTMTAEVALAQAEIVKKTTLNTTA